MHDYKDKIFEMLAVEPEQPFYLEDDIYEICAKANNKYKLTNDLTLYVHDKLDDEWTKSMFNIINILTGEFRIKHIKEPTEDDKVVIAYAKLCGYSWIAKDANGSTYALIHCGVTWKKIDDNLFIAEVPIAAHRFDKKSNDYKTSEIRQFLLNWYEKRKDW